MLNFQGERILGTTESNFGTNRVNEGILQGQLDTDGRNKLVQIESQY
ncbi:MAG: hypothetical protein IPM86_02875 [Saprospiraceae bacterium]|nr:hypothetical protein [Saprospiraceae bacterium]